MPRRRFLSFVALAALACASACGARSQLFLGGASPGAGGAGGATSSTSTHPTSTSSGGGMGGGGAPACVAWSFTSTQPVRITDLLGDMTVSGAVADGGDVLVATTNDNDPSPDPTWRLRAMSDDLSMSGLSEIVLQRPSSNVSFGGLSVAVGSSGRGAVAWDEAFGCRFVPIGDQGVPIGTPTSPASSWCYWLTPKDGGFVVFTSPSFELAPLTMLELDAHGNVLATHPDLVPPMDALTYPADRVRLADGSLLLAWYDGDASSIAQRFDDGGTAIGPPHVLVSGMPNELQLAIAPAGDGALVVWTPDASQGGIVAQTLDTTGNLGTEHVVRTQDGSATNGIDVVAVSGGALAAWMLGGSTQSLLAVQPLTNTGEAKAPLVTDILPAFASNVRLVATPKGAMVVFEAEEPNQPVQVYALALVCAD